MTRVVFLDDYQGAADRLAPTDRLDGVEWSSVHEHLTGEALVAAVSEANVIVAMRERTAFGRELFGRLPALELLVTTGPGNAAIDLAAADDQGIVVCATSARSSGNTAELTWGLILAVLRHLPEEMASFRQGGWQHTIGTDLAGSTLGLVGLGRIGSRMARIGQAFDMEVVAWSQHLDPERARGLGVEPVGKDELFARSDVASIHLVLSERSRGVVGRRELAAMKPTAVLVNTSRGPIVDEAALVDALAAGSIAGAGLDVFGEEPLPPDHPLRTMPRAVCTPHLGYVTEATLAQWFDDVVEDIEAWMAGRPIRVITASSPVVR